MNGRAPRRPVHLTADNPAMAALVAERFGKRCRQSLVLDIRKTRAVQREKREPCSFIHIVTAASSL
jgi:hypothetical protein